MIKIYTFPYDIPKTYYRAIGEFIAKVALLDFLAMAAIGELLKIDNPKQMRISFMGMQAKARLGALKALATNWSPNPTIKQEICSIVKIARGLVNVRNSFAHGLWGYSGNKRNLHVSFAEESQDFYLPRSKGYSSKEIQEKVKELRSVVKRLKSVTEALKALRAP